MTNPHGSWIWYELLTSDADAAVAFYEKVVGWTSSTFPGSPHGYTIVSAGKDGVGGIMKNPMDTGPIWLGYVGVDDVDASVAKIESLGGKVHMPPTTLDQVGRMSLVEDPQGTKIYVMRGASPDASHAYDRRGMGKGSWNELTTADQDAAFAFYGEMFGWHKESSMQMGPMGEYSFIAPAGSEDAFGAMMDRQKPDAPIQWNFYFRVPDIEEAFARVKANGGTPMHDPMEVPGGERVFYSIDPQGAGFGLVAPK